MARTAGRDLDRFRGPRPDLSRQAGAHHRAVRAKAAPRISARGLVLGRRRGAAAGVMALRSPAIRNRAGRGSVARSRAIVRSILPIEAGAGHRSVCARRRDRHRDAHPGAEADGGVGPAGPGGQSRRRRRQHRRRARGEGAARRLHAVHDLGLHRHREPAHVQEAQLEPGKGPGGDHQRGERAADHRRASRASRRKASRR